MARNDNDWLGKFFLIALLIFIAGLFIVVVLIPLLLGAVFFIGCGLFVIGIFAGIIKFFDSHLVSETFLLYTLGLGLVLMILGGLLSLVFADMIGNSELLSSFKGWVEK